MHIAILAGEVSGDLLGVALIKALKNYFPDAEFSGIGGRFMSQEDNFNNLGSIDTLAVMGLFEVISHLPKILKLKKELLNYWKQNPPDIFIGIDAPDFNLVIEKELKARGIKTVHFVSPSIWAWKEGRIKKIKKAVDLMLCLFPFEVPVYEKYGVKALSVGHPMIERLLIKTTQQARAELNIYNDDKDFPVLGIFAGSRKSEIERLLPIFLQAMLLMQVKNPNLRALISVANPNHQPMIEEIIAQNCPIRPEIVLSSETGASLISASNVLMLASGTITLEATILKRPMVVAYKVHNLTAIIARKLLKIDRYSLPNLLGDRDTVKELIQEDCTAENLAEELSALLNDPAKREKQLSEFQKIADNLPKSVSDTAAQAIFAMSKE